MTHPVISAFESWFKNLVVTHRTEKATLADGWLFRRLWSPHSC